MSVNRSAPIFGSGGRLWTALLDVFNWTTYSSLHKWIVVSFAALSVSWQFSLWTLLPLFMIASAAGVKVSEEILHNRKTSHFAELLFYKLESAYIEIRAVVKHLKIIYTGGPNLKDDSTLQAQLINELSSVYEIDDKSNDGNVPVRMSAELKLELNSIQLLIIRDFVRSWYADFSYDPQFLKETKYYLQESFNTLVMHLAQQDPQILLTKVIKLYHFHFAMYQKARNMYESHKVHPKIKVPDDSRFKRHSSLCDAFENTIIPHPALESEAAELSYLKGVVSILVLSACSSHLVEGPCVKTLLVQILTNKVMLPVMKMMSNPDWLMQVIIILTSDEKVIGEDMPVSNAENDIENPESNDKTIISSARRMSPGQSDSVFDSNLEWHEHLKDDKLVKSKLYSQTKASQLPSDLEECDRQVCAGDVCLHSKHHFHHDFSQSLPSLDPRAEDLKLLHSDKQQCPTYSIVVKGLITNDAQTSIPNGTCDQICGIEHVEGKQSLSKDVALMNNLFSKDLGIESFTSLTAVREECFAEGESDTDTFYDDPFTLVHDPQKIMSYRQRSSSSFDSDTWSATGHSTDRGSLSSESDTNSTLTSEADPSSETVTSSFPKLSSIKSFFVDSLKTSGKQQLVKKPKSLSLFSEKLASNLNPLTQKKRLKSKSNGHNSQEPPQLFVDGVPLDGQDVKPEDSQIFSVPTSVDDQPTPTYSDLEMTPSPGFFSSVNSFFHLSSSQNDMNKLCEGEGQKVSLTPTLSPTGQSDFGIGAIAVIKDSSDLKPFELDDRRIFQDVTIPETSICTEFRSTTQYSLYNVQYEALYFTEEGRSVIRSGKVRRRYREFLSLQSRLESHPGYKKYLKNMKVPKRWPTIPFKSIDKETVETRRLFLERYLKALTEIEAICNGPDLREFLAYEGDSHIAFVKKSPDITVPRFDKMFMRGVSEVVDRIKSLPNIPQEMMSGLRGRETPDDKQIRSRSHFDANTIDVNTAFHMDMISETSNILPMTSLQVLQDLDTEDDKDLIHNVITDPRNIEQTNEAYKQEVEKVLAALPRIQGDGSDLPDAKATDLSINLSLAVLDLLIQGLQQHDHWICRERVVRSMHSVLGKALNRYLETAISGLTTNQELAGYLKILRETIWPRGQLWSKSASLKTDDERQATREQAKRCLINFFPVSLRLVIGHKEFEAMIASFLSSLESEKMNRHILYLILDMLVEQLFPEVTSHDLLHSLLFSKSRSAHAP